jgi:hypothetical protein
MVLHMVILPTLMVWVIRFATREADRHVGLDAVMRFFKRILNEGIPVI